MPRRNVARCARRSAPDTIDTITELVLLNGHAWGIAEWEELLRSRHAFARAWTTWGEELTARWCEAVPGSRPLGAYIAGDIAPPALAHEWPACRHPVRLEGRVVIVDRGAWHRQVAELEHLDRLGLIDDDEHEAAVARLESEYPTGMCRYQNLADDGR